VPYHESKIGGGGMQVQLPTFFNVAVDGGHVLAPAALPPMVSTEQDDGWDPEQVQTL
jgi:hypothetical protein